MTSILDENFDQNQSSKIYVGKSKVFDIVWKFENWNIFDTSAEETSKKSETYYNGEFAVNAEYEHYKTVKNVTETMIKEKSETYFDGEFAVNDEYEHYKTVKNVTETMIKEQPTLDLECFSSPYQNFAFEENSFLRPNDEDNLYEIIETKQECETTLPTSPKSIKRPQPLPRISKSAPNTPMKDPNLSPAMCNRNRFGIYVKSDDVSFTFPDSELELIKRLE